MIKFSKPSVNQLKVDILFSLLYDYVLLKQAMTRKRMMVGGEGRGQGIVVTCIRDN